MNQGKSQTWFKYAAHILETYDIDYVAKSDTDTVLFLDKLLDFMDDNLPPAPYNRNILAGSVVDKYWWWEKQLMTSEKLWDERYFIKKFGHIIHLYVEGQIYIMSRDLANEKLWDERYFIKKFGHIIHLYVEGQIYIMSRDLANVVAEEAARHDQSYIEGHEDHDVSAMAFHSPKAIKLVIIARDQRFWKHDVKLKFVERFHDVWDREIARMTDLLNSSKVGAQS
jgi:hypothetical protein